MKIAPVIILLIAGGCIQPFAESMKAPAVVEAESLLVRQKYTAAKRVLADYCGKAANDIDALYLKIVIDQTELLDYESYSINGEVFLAAVDSVRSMLEKRLPLLRGRDSVRCLLYLGNLHGGEALIEAKNGSLFASCRHSLSSVSLLNETVRRDSTCTEALLGLGVFHYYLRKTFRWLPFLGRGMEEQGIAEIKKAVKAPFPFNFGARNSLCWILINQEKYGPADSAAAAVLAEYPGNTIFLRIRCLIALWTGQNDRAIDLGQELGRTSLVRSPVNWSDLVAAYYAIAVGNDALGRKKEACEAADFILGVNLPGDFMKISHIKKNMKHIKAIKEKCGQ